MTNVTYGKFVFSLSDLKITNEAGTVQEDLDAGMQLQFTPEFLMGKLDGDSARKAVASILMAGQAEVGAGSISSAALAIVTGKTLTTSGTSPNETTTLQMDASDRMPYFKIYGKSLDEGDGGVQILLSKVKLIGGLELNFEHGEWVTPGFELECLDDGTNGVFQLVQEETDSALPAS